MWNWRWAAPLLILIVYVTVQALNPSHSYQSASRSLLPQTYVKWLPYSTDADCTWEALGLLATYAAMFWVVCRCFRRVTECKILLMVLVINGFALALVAILQSVSGEQKLLWFRTSPIPEFMGSFVNRNNYAAYMNLLIPVALALGGCFGETRSEARSKGHPGYLFYFMAAVMAASVLRSGSRAGSVICVLLVGCWLWNLVFAGSDRAFGSWKKMFLIGSVVVVVAAGLLVLSGIKPVTDRFTAPVNEEELQMRENSNTRPAAYRATFEMFQDHWVYGTGAGTFHRAFPYYQPASLAGFWPYAHSDWLQWIAELGVLGSVLMVMTMGGILQRCVRNYRQPRERVNDSPESRVLRQHFLPALGFGVAGVALHACVDFPLHIPAVAVLAVACWALVYQSA